MGGAHDSDMVATKGKSFAAAGVGHSGGTPSLLLFPTCSSNGLTTAKDYGDSYCYL